MLFIVVLSVIISVPVLSGIMLNVFMITGGLLDVVMQSCHCSEYCYPDDVMLSVVILSLVVRFMAVATFVPYN